MLAQELPFAAHNRVPTCRSGREKTMRSAATALAMAVGGTSLICYLLMTRLQNRRANRGSSRQSPSLVGGNRVAEAINPPVLRTTSALDSF